jgi:Fe-S-cluster containining protein
MTAFFTSGTDPDNDVNGIAKWYAFHRCQVCRVTNAEGKANLGVKIPLVCIHLERMNGAWACKIYEDRPVVCQKYLCESAKHD